MLASRGSLARMHCLPWVAEMATVLKSLYRWDTKFNGVAASFRRQPDRLPALDPFQIMIPSATEALALLDQPRAAPMSGAVSLVQDPSEADAVACLAQINRMLQSREGESVAHEELSDVHLHTLDALAREGAIEMAVDGLGSLRILRLIPDGIKYVSLQTVGGAAQALHLNIIAPNVKLDLVLSLIRKGWHPRKPPRSSFKPGGALHFLAAYRRLCSYFACLLEHERLFAKNILEIRHDWKDLQYQCLLRLNGEKLGKILEGLEGATDKWMREQLKTISVDDVCGAPEIEDWPEEGGENEPEPDLQAFPPLVPSVLDRNLIVWQRRKVICNLEVAKVIFDHYSSGDRQRGYVNCLCKHHQNCFRWKFADQFVDRESYCAYMYSWATGGDHLDNRDAHMTDFEPDPENIEVVKATMELQDFQILYCRLHSI